MNLKNEVEVIDERHAATPQPNFHHEGHEEHEEKPCRWAASKLRGLRVRGEQVLLEKRAFSSKKPQFICTALWLRFLLKFNRGI
jgi:hypothetical protein